MRSMTGYGQAFGENRAFRVSVSLRSVNSRYLDIGLRMRDEFTGSEAELRELLSSELHRGRVDAAIEIVALGERELEVHIHTEVIEGLQRQLSELSQRGISSSDLTVTDLLQLPEVVEVRAHSRQWSTEDHDLLISVTGQALAELVRSRLEEGRRLAETLDEKVTALRPIVDLLRRRRLDIRQEAHGALRLRLQELLAEQEVDDARISQEAALWLEKSDVAEELDRLAAHVEHFVEVCDQEQAVGRRLDFLVQEMMREINTLGAKCRDTEMSRLVLDAKVLCEQLREQLQNVE